MNALFKPKDVAARWSLKSLSHLGGVSPESSKVLLEDVVHRLAKQQEAADEMISWVKNEREKATTSSQKPSSESLYFQKALKQLDTVQFIQNDTRKLGKKLLESRQIWDRFHNPDRHVVNATFLELRARHVHTIEHIVDVINYLRKAMGGHTPLADLHKQAEAFLQRRLGIQLLCDHHAELYKGKENGAVDCNASLGEIISDSVLEAQRIVDAHLNWYPDVLQQMTTDYRICVVKPWLQYVLVEVLKNAMAATIKRVDSHNAQRLLEQREAAPPIELHVCKHEQRIDITVVDQGTGIAGGQAGIENAFLLGHTSAGKKFDRLDVQQSYAAVRSPLSSLGVGLPSSRYMMEHFHGILTIDNNHDMAGCSATLQIRLDDSILERVPGETSKTFE
jgi:pyruvate dehydrogenase kinase 2/3/4